VSVVRSVVMVSHLCAGQWSVVPLPVVRRWFSKFREPLNFEPLSEVPVVSSWYLRLGDVGMLRTSSRVS